MENNNLENNNLDNNNPANSSPEQSVPSVDEAVAQAIQASEVEAEKAQKKDWKKELREWVVSIAVALLVVFVVRTFLFQIIRVDGNSMNSTLLDGERLFVTVADVKLKGVERGDIVICNYPNRGKTNFVKRIVALPGDQVYRDMGVTHVLYETTDENGETITVDEMLDERWAIYYMAGSPDDYEPYTLGEDEYFAVGDNRYNSHDSRDWRDSNPVNDVGPITGDMIIGKVQAVIWPLSEIRLPE